MLSVFTAPAEEPISLTEAKKHCWVDISDDDTYITALITAAREYTEKYCGLTFVTTIFDLTMDGFGDSWYARCGYLMVPRPPLQSVTHIKYIDTDGVEQTWDSAKYAVDIKSKPGRISLAYNETWPTTRDQLNSVTIRFPAGFGAASAVPAMYKHAIKLLVKLWYDERAPVGTVVAEVPFAFKALCGVDRIRNA